jgi:hypothetical protein
MPASTSRSAAHLATAVLIALLVSGCAGETPTSTAASQATTTSTVAPTTTTVAPMTAKELAWLKAIPKVSKKIEKSIGAISNLSTSGMANLANSLRSCSRELARGGSPSDPLQPVYTLVKKACREYDKGAVCFTTAARIGIPFCRHSRRANPVQGDRLRLRGCRQGHHRPWSTPRTRARTSRRRLADDAISAGLHGQTRYGHPLRACLGQSR